MIPPPPLRTSVLGVGAWLKNAACLWLDGQAHWSTVHGDLSDPQACRALEHSVQALLQQARDAGAPVQAIAHDLHPDFFSTQLALRTAQALGVPAVAVQHHHAHLAAVIARHGLRKPVVGLAADGVGLGSDGQAWGGELLWLDGAHWQRLGHLQTLALPGGDRAAREPWRMAASVLQALGRADEIVPRFGPTVGEASAKGLRQMLAAGLNCPPSSSTGRWFDAAAAALGLCLHQQHEAQAAMQLEQLATDALARRPDLPPLPGASLGTDGQIVLAPLLGALFDASDVGEAAAGFHLALADVLALALAQAAQARGASDVVLGGGCFFNQLLCDRLARRLLASGLAVWWPGPAGCGDAGLAIGQAWVAAQLLQPAPAPCFESELQPCA